MFHCLEIVGQIIKESGYSAIAYSPRLSFESGGKIRHTHQSQRTAVRFNRMEAALRSEWKNREAAISEINARHLEIAAAEHARDGVKEEARLGERTVLDILDADQDLLSSQAALIEARRAELLARYRIYALLGQLPNI